tara:strand:- start:373 stop:1182 length:810 start_codon:yes stop_codon:yes gene_type:complete
MKRMKMSRLWLFGDSYVYGCHSKGHWGHDLALQLNIAEENILNFGGPGCGPDWVCYQLVKHMHQFNKNNMLLFFNKQYGLREGAGIAKDDYAVVVIPPIFRSWFIDEAPEASHFPNLGDKAFVKGVLKNDRIVDKALFAGQVEAAKQYYYTRSRPDKVHFDRFAIAILLKYIQQNAFCNLVHVYSDPINEAEEYHIHKNQIGILDDISTEEFATEAARNKYHMKNNNKDFRNNHLSRDNHKIFANKLFTFFENGDTIDFTKDFLKGIYK